jgi:hypothetical protein
VTLRFKSIGTDGMAKLQLASDSAFPGSLVKILIEKHFLFTLEGSKDQVQFNITKRDSNTARITVQLVFKDP